MHSNEITIVTPKVKWFNHAITPKRGDYNLQHIYFGTVQSLIIIILWWANQRCPSQEEEEEEEEKKKTFGVPQLINMRHKYVVILSSKEITTISQSIVSHLSKLAWKNWSIFSNVEIFSHTRRKDWKLLARLLVQLLTSYQDHQSSSPHSPSSDKGLTKSSKVSIHNTSILEVAPVKLLGK
jgi:hypothetical protein